jgi:hypothetical protein
MLLMLIKEDHHQAIGILPTMSISHPGWETITSTQRTHHLLLAFIVDHHYHHTLPTHDNTSGQRTKVVAHPLEAIVNQETILIIQEKTLKGAPTAAMALSLLMAILLVIPNSWV